MKDFTTGSIPKLMMKFLVPLLLSNILQALYMLIDAVWAGRLLGPSGVAIVTSAMPVIFLMASLLAGIAIGASILAGQAYGSKNCETLSDIISTSAIGTVILSLVVSVLGIVFCDPLLRLINTPPQLFGGAHIFLAFIIGGIGISSIVQWFSAILNAMGDARTPFKILLISLFVNAVLAPVLITGVGIFPPLGLAGSALSTIIANIVSVIICFFVWRNHKLSKIAPFRFSMHWQILKKIAMVGFPMALQMIIVSASFLFILSLANKFGPNVTAAFGIGSRVDQFAFLAIFAVTMAISMMTAQNIGAGKIERVTDIAKWGILFSLLLAFLFFAAVMIFPDTITMLFTKDAAITLLTRRYFRYIGVSYLALSILFAFQGILRGAGDTITSFIIIAFTMIFLRVPLCYYLSHSTALREVGLWLGISISSFAGAVIFYFYYAGGRWKKCKHRMQEPCEAETVVLQPEAL